MSLVDIRVDLPSYSRSFVVKVQPSSSVLDIKQEIYHTCPGQPRTTGQRLIWRGRLLADEENIDDLWKNEPRIVHLAVHPSAWSSPPQVAQPQPHPQPLAQPQPTPTFPTHHTPSPIPTPAPPRWNFTTQHQQLFNPSQPPRSPLVYVLYQHQKALACLCPSITSPRPNIYECSPSARAIAVQALERSGFIWPTILDEPYPVVPTATEGVKYKVTEIDGGLFLHLVDSHETPTPMQEHALKVLSYTFTILTISIPPAPTVRTITPQSTPLPPHVNELLQQLGMPPLRVVNNNGNPVGNQPNAAIADIRQIPIRPLLAPLMMLLLRTMLLLYFVAPTRTPIFGVLILAWMLYEIWQPIRNGLQNGWGRAPPQNQQQQRENNAPVGVQNAGQPNAVPAPGGPPAANVPVRPGPVGPVTLDLQAGALFDSLANLNIEEEQRVLNQTTGTPAAEPGLGHKITTFLSLFVTTLHPAIWNRRRVALRRREGVVRTEANARNAPPPPDSGDGETPATSVNNVAAQRREELRAQFNRRPGWIQRYMERVVAEDWVDDSD